MLLASLLDSVRKPTADVVIGLDDKQLEKALQSGLFAPLTLKNISEISNALVRDPMKGSFLSIMDSLHLFGILRAIALLHIRSRI